MRAVILFGCVLAGCYNPAPQEGAPCGPGRECPDGLECNFENKCVKPGGEVPVDACPENACDGDVLVGCGTMTTCANGCGGTTPHCLTLAPSNGLNAMMLVGATADMTMDKLNFDATDGSIRIMNMVIRPDGDGVLAGIRWEVVDGVSVWTANTWTLVPGDSWEFSGSRPIALFAASTISIGASINFSAGTSTGVFGGTSSNASTTLVGCQGRAGRNVDATHADGGGGAGGGDNTRGGNGAGTNTGTNTGLGGQCVTRPSTTPLLGGNGGGNGGGGALGGGGGGAIALVAMESVTIANTAYISVSGAGGNGGTNGGGGGGSGGAIFVEAPTVTIMGQLAANGGGGGAPGGGTAGGNGADTTSTVAQGGTYSGAGGPARGGNGAAGTTAATNGTSYNNNVDDGLGNITNFNRGGGGGGAAGKIEVKRKAGTVTGLASPAAALTNAVFE